MSNKIHIYLNDNPTGIYYPGQNVSGRVECIFPEEEDIKNLKIQFKGGAKTEWTDTETYYDDNSKEQRTGSITYNDDEVYFYSEHALYQCNDRSVPIGRCVYPFSYLLPQRLPSSFEGRHGSVTYSIKVVVDYPWKFSDSSMLKLNIVSPLDLNSLPELREAVATSVDKTPCSCWCQNSGPITFNMSVPLSGFVPGQQINITACVENLSNVSAESTKFQIFKNVAYKVNLPFQSKDVEEVIVENIEPGIGAHSERSWTSSLIIPNSGCYPNLTFCNLMKVTYYLKGKLVLPCPHKNLSNKIDLVVGSIPLCGVNIGRLDVQQAYNASAPMLNNANAPAHNMGWSISAEGSKSIEFIDAPPAYDEIQQIQNHGT